MRVNTLPISVDLEELTCGYIGPVANLFEVLNCFDRAFKFFESLVFGAFDYTFSIFLVAFV
jgi:hypothetical protein